MFFKKTYTRQDYAHLSEGKLVKLMGEDIFAKFEYAKRKYNRRENPYSYIPLLEEAANKDIDEACYLLGEIYHKGESVKKDDDKALIYYEKAVRMNYYKAYYPLSLIYYWKDLFDDAIKMAKLAYEKGQNEGVEVIYYSYLNLGNEEEAKKWMIIGAKTNNIILKSNLADAIYNGEMGFEVDYKKAFQLYKETISLNSSKCSMAIMLLKGEGCEKDAKKGVGMLLELVDTYPFASLELGKIKIEGKYGVLRNITEAIKYCMKAKEDKSIAYLAYTEISVNMANIAYNTYINIKYELYSPLVLKHLSLDFVLPMLYKMMLRAKKFGEIAKNYKETELIITNLNNIDNGLDKFNKEMENIKCKETFEEVSLDYLEKIGDIIERLMDNRGDYLQRQELFEKIINELKGYVQSKIISDEMKRIICFWIGNCYTGLTRIYFDHYGREEGKSMFTVAQFWGDCVECFEKDGL